MPRVDEMPEAGRVVIAHPRNEEAAAALAGREGTPYLLHRLAPLPTLYVLDIDLIRTPFEWGWLDASR